MYQPFLMEKANFYTEHGHLPEQERLRLWTQHRNELDEHGLVEEPTSPSRWLDAGSYFGRRLSVPGNVNTYPMNSRLSRSAPPSFCVPRTNDFDAVSVSPEPWGSTTGPRSQDDTMIPAYDRGCNNDGGFGNQPLDMVSSTISLGTDHTEPIDPTLYEMEETGYLDPGLQDSMDSTLASSPHSQTCGNTFDPPGCHDGLVDMPWTEDTTNITSYELTLGSSLVDDISREDSAFSSTITSGGIVCESFGFNFPYFANFHHVDFVPQQSPCFTTHSQYEPSIGVNSCVNTMNDSSTFHSTCFDFSQEDDPRLSSVSFPTSSPAFVYSTVASETIVKSDSPPIKTRNSPPIATEPSNLAPRQENGNGLRRLLAKAADVTVSSSSSSDTLAENTSQEGKRKLAISKSSYIRPKHPKKFCHLCNDYPDGFRAEHELRRHVDRAHMLVRKMFICVDQSHDGKFLENCKKCKNGKKYGAYYNAAAHLRRVHFSKRQRSRGGRGRSYEKRESTGGGEQPSMEFLKGWIQDVPDLNPQAMVVSDSSSDDEMTPEAVLSTNDFEACSSFDSDETIYDYSPYSIKETSDATSFAVPSEGDTCSSVAMNHVNPTFETSPKFVPPNITSCPHSLEPSFFPPFHRLY